MLQQHHLLPMGIFALSLRLFPQSIYYHPAQIAYYEFFVECAILTKQQLNKQANYVPIEDMLLADNFSTQLDYPKYQGHKTKIGG